MINDDESQRQANNSAQAAAENLQPGGDGTRRVIFACVPLLSRMIFARV